MSTIDTVLPSCASDSDAFYKQGTRQNKKKNNQAKKEGCPCSAASLQAVPRVQATTCSVASAYIPRRRLSKSPLPLLHQCRHYTPAASAISRGTVLAVCVFPAWFPFVFGVVTTYYSRKKRCKELVHASRLCQQARPSQRTAARARCAPVPDRTLPGQILLDKVAQCVGGSSGAACDAHAHAHSGKSALRASPRPDIAGVRPCSRTAATARCAPTPDRTLPPSDSARRGCGRRRRGFGRRCARPCARPSTHTAGV